MHTKQDTVAAKGRGGPGCIVCICLFCISLHTLFCFIIGLVLRSESRTCVLLSMQVQRCSAYTYASAENCKNNRYNIIDQPCVPHAHSSRCVYVQQMQDRHAYIHACVSRCACVTSTSACMCTALSDECVT